MNAQEVIELEQSHVLGVYGRAPFVLARGEGSTLYDTEGRAYLDCVAGIAVNALGYNDAGVAQSMGEALASGMVHVSNLYHTAPHARLAALLCETSFADKVHFCNSGAEANEGAFKFARRYGRAHGDDDKVEILAFTNAFHGRTMGALAATPRPKYQDPFKPLMPGVRFAAFNNVESARAQMDAAVCAIIVEPIQGEGGIHAATPDFLAGLRALADEYDALLIYDEVQCGVGRTGTLWAHQGYCTGADDCLFAPDILTAAKPLAAGLPIGAILMRQRVADTIQKGDHGSTFAGGPLVTSVAHHVVSRVAQPAFLAEVQAKGKLLHDLLEEINSPHIVELRGKGLLVGVELDVEAADVVARGYDEGLILVNAGPTVLRLAPPLVITEAEIHEVVARLTRILHAL
ncbi:acetylornithine/succinylornithine family transaminase [Caldilinea sp.]|uniref:aspartate aminotransferase family protein n=1 Tax=Caldilinea sp. TaxID=2293560 RepID=UPI002BD69920|nr:acetylornithine/succinylornithine family transaminase [Caldilinea sp.]